MFEENTTNKGGGAIYDLNEIVKIRELCDKKKLGLHLDGARLWNALKLLMKIQNNMVSFLTQSRFV